VKILALDLATKSGFAVGNTGGKPFCFTKVLGEIGAPHGKRFCQCLQTMNRVIKEQQPDLIVLEAPFKTHKKTDTNVEFITMGLRAVAMAVGELHGVPFEQYAVRTIRKHFIGYNPPREEAKAATVKRCGQLGYKVWNDDEADAAALWDYACSRLSRSHSLANTPLFGDKNAGS